MSILCFDTLVHLHLLSVNTGQFVAKCVANLAPPQTKPKQTSNSWHWYCGADQVIYKTTEQWRSADLGELAAKEETFNKDEGFKEDLKKNGPNIKVVKGDLEKKQIKLL